MARNRKNAPARFNVIRKDSADDPGQVCAANIPKASAEEHAAQMRECYKSSTFNVVPTPKGWNQGRKS